MKILTMLYLATVAAGVSGPARASATPSQIYTCDTTIALQPTLRVEDEASVVGALVEDASLITLPNSMKAVQFSVRYAKRLLPSDRILKVRYTVTWFDDCGRALTNGSNTTDGLILNPRQRQTIQATAMHPDATRALFRIYVD
jgi:uncharacterized protein YcfL